MKTVKDTGKGIVEAFKQAVPKERDYLDMLGVLHSPDARAAQQAAQRGRGAYRQSRRIADLPETSRRVLKNQELTHFICDYCRLIIIGNARTHEIEALMDEEIQTIRTTS